MNNDIDKHDENPDVFYTHENIPPDEPAEVKAGKKFREYLPHIIIFLLAFVGLYVYLKLNDVAFPTENINFRIDKKGAKSVALDYLNDMDYSAAGYQSSVTFSYYNNAKEFLEKSLPLEEANRYMGKKVPVWYWKVRFFKYFKKKEYVIYVDPSGRIIKFVRIISDDEPGSSFSVSGGKEKAFQFLEKQGVNTDNLELIEQGGKPLKNRTDRSYTFKEKGFDISGAFLYYGVKFQGEEPGYYSNYLHIPQKTKLAWKEGDKKGVLLVNIANLFTFFLILGIIIYAYFHGLNFRWKFAVIIAIGVVLVVLLEQVNSLALAKSSYSTDLSYFGFWTNVWLSILGTLVLFGIISFFVGSLGISLQEGGGRIKDTILVLGGAKIPLNIIIGYAVALIVLGYDVLFYFWGKKYFGVWTPLDISYDNILSTPLPWVNALFVGFSAAALEEIFFRMCGISFLIIILKRFDFLKKYRLDTIIAIVIPAIIWAALHCSYPQEPYYIRAIELTFVGILLGWIYLKYGILSTIVSHYCLNAVYGSTLLLKSGNPYFVISGYITIGLMLIPAIIALVFRKKIARIEKKSQDDEKRRQEASKKLELAGIDLKSPEEERTSVSYTILEKPIGIPGLKFALRKKVILGIIAVLGILGLLFIRTPKLGEGIKFTASPYQAKNITREFLKNNGVDLSHSATAAEVRRYPETDESIFLSQKLGIKNADSHMKKYLPMFVWVVDVNFDKKKESYRVLLKPSGDVFTYFHRITDETGSGKISKEKAEKIAAAYLNKFPGKFEYKDFQQTGQKKRIDYNFIYREKAGDIAGTKLFAGVNVQDEKAMGLKKYFEIPDNFKRKLQEKGLVDSISSGFLAIVGLIFFVWTIIYSIKRKLRGKVNVKFGFYFAVPITIVMLIGRLNIFTDIWTGISFDEPFSGAIINWIISTVLSTFSVGMVVFYVFTILETLYRDVFPDKTPPALWITAVWRGNIRKSYAFWGIISAYVLVLLSSFPLTSLVFDDKKLACLKSYNLWAGFVPGISYLPAVRILSKSIVEGIIIMGLVVLFILFLKRIFNRNILVIGALVLCVVMMEIANFRDAGFTIYFLAILLTVIKMGLIGAFVMYFFRDNLFAYIVLPVVGMCAYGVNVLIGSGNTFFLANGIVLAVLLLALPFTPLFLGKNEDDVTIAASE
ncbi:MAG: CPBP family intramembrane metalloprotease [Candidatus Eremiobacteraeota bacterium]|nr:CPBP family intramembrane metalloprotease [Candidatus Eremiobacteraeota bacterium]